MKKVVGVFALLLLAGCCSSGSHWVSKKPREGVDAQTDMQGKTKYNSEWFKFKCEQD